MSQAKVNEQAADLLEAAALVIQLPGWWTKRAAARDEHSEEVLADCPMACQFCGYGGLWAAAGERGSSFVIAAERALDKAAGRHFPDFNDRVARSGKQVAMLMLRAAQELRGEVSA